MCLFAETEWGAAQRGGAEGTSSLVGKRASKTGGCKKEQRTFMSFWQMLEQVECRVFTQFIFQYTKKTQGVRL